MTLLSICVHYLFTERDNNKPQQTKTMKSDQPKKKMTTKTKFVSIEKNNGDIDLCFWADKEKTDLESFSTCRTMEQAKERLTYWTSEKKTLEKA